ncbi:MAG TPA: ABC transporter ATP-binding protein, partial [Kofleriaceae bacterium]|nr:ABC transporter ATP-binding protein [Kofleriaceae bacterium]
MSHAARKLAGSEAGIRIEGIGKRFGKKVALAGISLTLPDRGVVILAGENGAGKSTLLRIITGYLDPDAGDVWVAGHHVGRARIAAQSRCGYLPESVPLYPEMTVTGYLHFRARLKRIASRDAGARVAAALDQAGVREVRDEVIGHLSRGFRQRVGIADALLGDPAVLILDEPASGLDPVQARNLRATIARCARDRLVLVSTHRLAEVETIAARVVILVAGRVRVDGDAAEIARAAGLGPGTALEDAFVAI